MLVSEYYTVTVFWGKYIYRVWYIMGLSPGGVKTKTMKLVFSASPLSMQH